MDIVRKKSKLGYKRVVLIGILAIISVFISMQLWSSTQNISLNIDSQKVQTAKVKKGDLQVKVAAFGKIASNNINMISSEVDGFVAKIHIKSGERVVKGQILIELTNPKLHQKVEENQWNLEELESQHRELQLSNKSLSINAEISLFEIEKQLNISNLRLSAQEKLIKLHNVVSKIAYEETKLNNEMLKRQFRLEKEKSAHLKQQIQAKAAADMAKVNKTKKILNRAKSQVEALTIYASFSGYIDEFNIDLGQNLVEGEKIAKIIGDNGFYAELRVPEYNASQVEVNQAVLIETRSQTINGSVTRISPSVEDGNVKVDVKFTSKAAEKPRLEQAISGSIIVKKITGSLYIKRPVYAKNNLRTVAYKRHDKASSFTRSTISFGALSDDLIEIKHGVSVGDVLITSDISTFIRHESVSIN